MRNLLVVSTLLCVSSLASVASAQTIAAPPPEAKAMVTGPKLGEAPKVEKATDDSTSISVAAGGLLTTGNSRLLALSMNGAFDMRRAENGFGASIVGNYGQGAPPGKPVDTTAENVQGRLRYDRYLVDSLSLFLITTGRYDRFQGLAFRLNLDPGVKYIFFKDDAQSFWGELGYDFQFDTRTESGRVQADATGKPDPALPLNAKTRTDHSARAFLGYKRAFNADVAFSTGIEYLQSFVDTDISKKDSRLNFDATLTAKLMEGFSLGVGFQARYSKDPLPGKEQLDTSTTLSIIYGWNDIKPPKKEEEAAKCPACPEPPPCPAQTAPAAPATPSPASNPAPAAAQPAAATPSAPATQPAVTTSAPATPAAPVTTPAPK